MARTTIDYGIDLGTTNSEVAVLRDTRPEIIPNQDGRSFTPSAVWIDKRGNLHVGHQAKARVVDDPDNAAAEFKLQMGSEKAATKVFAATGRQMLPEELSAEVLKSLRADVRNSTGEDLRAAVITVPAAFDLPQCDATRRAAELAGIEVGTLLQEPVAAALAYGFQSKSDKVFWLVYDFGGGTFDAAIVQIRDGIIQVVNHAGDNHLGGKLIDWDIIEMKLIPALTANYNLPDFGRGNLDWRFAMAKLKAMAEKAKIQVSRTEASYRIGCEDPSLTEYLCKDADGQVVELEYDLSPEQLADLAAPHVERSLNLCRKALAEARLSGRDIEKVLLVGGTSLLPSLHQVLQDKLGIPLESSIDPITVVALGAAIFAGTQRLKVSEAPAPGQFRIELEYEPIGSEIDPEVGGRVNSPDGTSVEGFSIEFIETRTEWRSGKIRLAKNGAFLTKVHADAGRRNEFRIELCDATGTVCQTVPDRLVYTIGITSTNAPLTHAVGVAMANRRVDPFFKKGESLPARRMLVHETAYPVRKGQEGDVIRIQVVEGENIIRDDRNRLIGSLVISASDPRVKRDIPASSEVEITLAIDESRLVTAKAYVPLLDEEFEKILTFEKKQRPTAELRGDLEKERARLSEVEGKATRTNAPQAQEALAQISREDIVGQVESMLAAAERGDQDAVTECDKRLQDLKGAIDRAEDAVALPALVETAHTTLDRTRDAVSKWGEAAEKQQLAELEQKTQPAIDSGDFDILKDHVEKVEALGTQVVVRQAWFWIGYLEYLESEKDKMQDQAQADLLFAQGRRAINDNDLEALKAAVRQLIALLPFPDQVEARGYGGTTIRWDR